MIKVLKATIWGRQFELPVVYDCYKGEEITDEQINAIIHFFNHLEWIELARGSVEYYCKKDVMADDENVNKDNIFSYLKPESLFVKHEEMYPRVALICKYRYDLEHGLAVVFSVEGEVTIGTQDIIL